MVVSSGSSRGQPGRRPYPLAAPHPQSSTGLAAADGIVIYAVNGHLTGYDDRTGQPRWATAGGVPSEPDAQLVGGLVLLTSNAQGPGISTALTAVIPATGAHRLAV